MADDPTQAALVAAAVEHWSTSGSAAFVIPLPDTEPRLFVAVGRPKQILEALRLAGHLSSDTAST